MDRPAPEQVLGSPSGSGGRAELVAKRRLAWPKTGMRMIPIRASTIPIQLPSACLFAGDEAASDFDGDVGVKRPVRASSGPVSSTASCAGPDRPSPPARLGPR